METEVPDESDETVEEDGAGDRDESDVPEDDEESDGTSESDETVDENGTGVPIVYSTYENDDNSQGDDDSQDNYKYEATGTDNGATYENGNVTFWITTDDPHYSSVNKVYFKPYANFDAAKADHIKTNSATKWLDTTDSVPLTENLTNNKKTYEVTVNKDEVGAYLYYFPTDEDAEDAARTQHEHIIVINPAGVDSSKLPPDVPQGLVAHFWADENAAAEKLGKIYVAWNLKDAGENVKGYKLRIDSEEYILISRDELNNVGEWFLDNVFAVGTHTITLIAYNNEGKESGAEIIEFNLTADQAYGGKYSAINQLKDLVESEKDRYNKGNEDSKYSTDDWNQYTTAMKEAEEVLKKSYQATAEEATNAYNNLKAAVDKLDSSSGGSEEPDKPTKKDLEDAINKYDKYDKDDYEDEGWDEFEDALKDAKDVLKDDEASDDDIDEALKKLKDAADKLTEKSPKDKLKDAIDKYDKFKKDDYEDEGWEDFKDALDEAKKVRDNDKATEDEIKEALKKLEDAAGKLQEKQPAIPEKPDKTALDEAIKKYSKYEEDDYKPEGWNDFQSALNAAQVVNNNDNATQEEVVDALANLNAAADKLMEKTPREKLKDAIDKYEKDLNENEDKYTKDSVDKLKEELKNSNDLLDKEPPATEDELKKALEDLKDAADNLKNKPTKDDLDAAIKKYKEDKDKYTEDSWNDFEKVLDEAEKVNKDENATQDEIEKALEDLEDAAKDLVKKPTKENLQEIIDKYKDKYDEDDYTDDSWKDFKDALDEADKVAGKDNPTEDEIEDALKKLEDAVDNLVPIKNGLWIKEIAPQTYTGSAIKPVLRVYEGTTLLEEKTDYTVSYKNNTNVGTAQVTVKGKRDYGKTKTVTFKIKEKRISDADVTVADVCAVISNQNTVKDPKVTIKYGNKTLKLNKDYFLTYPKLSYTDDGKIVAKDYTITVVGDGNYKGTRYINYTVYPMPDANAINMSKVKVDLNKKTVVYNGKETEKPTVTISYKGALIAVIDPKKNDDPNLNFEVSYLNSDRVGKATVMVSAKLKPEQQYYGSKSVTYTVTGTPLNKKNVSITGIESYTYTGSEIKVKDLKVKDVTKDVLLVEGKDYDIVYSKNINAGKAATITLTGKNGYSGKYVQKFTINKKPLDIENDPDLTWKCAENAAYTKSKAVPTCEIAYKGVALREKMDYTIKCVDNNATGNAAKITITGKGNYVGTKTFNYKVKAPDLTELYVADMVKPQNVAKLRKSVKVYEKSTGKALKAGTDYDKNDITLSVKNKDGNVVALTDDANLEQNQEIYIKISLLGNYKEADEATRFLETSFHLYDKKTATFKVVKVGPQEYTGKAVEPPIIVLSKDGKITMDQDVDYKVTYSNNIERGKGKATVTGISNQCRGVTTITFQIGTRNLSNPINWFEEATKTIKNVLSNFFNR
ncbi:MAG: hypothetical protein HDR09_00820 [Lachnospiraceae bacterium]|nr:hypothetical protein [Lachnospiraceae bacterium]